MYFHTSRMVKCVYMAIKCIKHLKTAKICIYVIYHITARYGLLLT